jgi:hypothetical protein
MRKFAVSRRAARPVFFLRTRTMEAERINQIGHQIEDLTARTAELRGYL